MTVEYHDDVEEETPEMLLDRLVHGAVVLVLVLTVFMMAGAVFKACADSDSNNTCTTDEVRRCGCDEEWTTLGYQRCHDGIWSFCDCEDAG
jgi:hypothetical protein